MSLADSARVACNPFATRYFKPGATAYRSPLPPHLPLDEAALHELANRLRSVHRAMIVGPHGSGKSTLVHSLVPALAEHYNEIVWERFNRDPTLGWRARLGQRLKHLRQLAHVARLGSRGGLVVLDGMEQVPSPARWLFCVVLAVRHCDLLVTSHDRLGGFTELYRVALCPSLIRHLADELTRDVDHQCAELVQQELDRRDLTQVTNARDLWFELYDRVADYNASPASRT